MSESREKSPENNGVLEVALTSLPEPSLPNETLSGHIANLKSIGSGRSNW